MPFHIARYESTPNPNAVKCWLDRPISEQPRSFLNVEMAKDDPVARALFEEAAATSVLFNGDWITVNKPPEIDWPVMKQRIEKVLSSVEAESES